MLVHTFHVFSHPVDVIHLPVLHFRLGEFGDAASQGGVVKGPHAHGAVDPHPPAHLDAQVAVTVDPRYTANLP